MRQTRSLASLLTLFVGIIFALLSFSSALSAQEAKDPPLPVYNPYPPGILPANVNTELARVLREIAVIENEAIGQWHALPPPMLTGQPPTLQGSGYSAVRILGKLMNFDRNMSPLKNIACASCHMPYAGFSGPIPSVNLTMVAYPGSFRFRAGKRTAQRYTYSPDFPVLNYNTEQGAFFGGNFWDARSTGYQHPQRRSSLVLATPTSDYPGIPETPFTIRPPQTPWDLQPMREASHTPIWD
jgi:hypothetical protein